MMPTKKQMRIINKHFRGDADGLIKTAKRVGILDPYTFLQHAVDAGLNAKGTEAMMFMGCDNPKDVVDSYSKIVSSSESISQMRGTKKWKGIVFDTDRVRQEMGKLLQRDQNTHDRRKKNTERKKHE